MGEKKIRKSPVGARLKEARLREGLSQKGLGIKAGIDEFSSSARINQYERDKHVPDYQTATRLAESLNIPVSYLFTEDDDLAEIVLKYYKSNRTKQNQIKKIFKEL